MLRGKPFVKWAGGKRQIIDKLKQYIPEEFDVYYEPFIGGGALLFELSPKKAVINDYNEELMNVFECIKDEEKYSKMKRELNKHEANHSEKYVIFYLNCVIFSRFKQISFFVHIFISAIQPQRTTFIFTIPLLCV